MTRLGHLVALAMSITGVVGLTYAADPALPWRATLVREAQAVYGVEARVPMFAGQIRQESGWRADVTAWDGGAGLAQFMASTAAMVSRTYPELGAPDPYNPRWAIRALVRYDAWLYARVQGATPCQRWAAALKGYNAGLGYVQRAQARSSTPARWFAATEDVNAGQSAKNFEYSRLYPRWILFKHQPLYVSWGVRTCGDAP
jgi:soluble lytic murein transglycosylase-like protein